MKKIILTDDWIKNIDTSDAKKEPFVGNPYVGALYVGTFYFEHFFWMVRIPVAFGRVRLDAFDSLTNMAPETKKLLALRGEEFSQFNTLWTDCVDYGFGVSELESKTRNDAFSLRLVRSGDQQLRSCVTLLLEENANPKSMESAHMAVEMFMKFFISLKGSLDEKQARKFGHNLEELLDKCLDIEPNSALGIVRPKLDCFPAISERYEGAERTKREMWNAYRVAQFVATTIIREFTGRNMRNSVFQK